MVNFIKNITIRKFWLLKLWWDKKDTYLHQIGWINSFNQGKPLDKNGEAIPWLSYPIVHFIDTRLNKNQSIFEYGAGNSSIFFSKRVKKVVSLEHVKEWVDFLKPSLPDNAALILESLENGDAYARSAVTYGEKFHIILIDGRDRVNCCKYAREALTEDGIIIFDDTHRERYKAATDVLEAQGFKRLDFWGIGPGSIFLKCSSLFYREKNCFNI